MPLRICGPGTLGNLKTGRGKAKPVMHAIISTLIVMLCATHALPKGMSRQHRAWENQLNELNYLVTRTSSINIIHGLFLSREQAARLKALAKRVESLQPAIPTTKGKTFAEFKEVRQTFLELIPMLVHKKPLSDKVRNRVMGVRLRESDLIKKSVVGAERGGWKGKSCIKCHVLPRRFPKGDASKLETSPIGPKIRREIDSAHVSGIFGAEITYRFWELKEEVDTILTNGQRHVLKEFRCCMLPPKQLSDPTRVGQAFSSDEWIQYFIQVRSLPDEQWVDFKNLYIVPIEDLIKATLPGIQSSERERILKEIDRILEDARKMDEIDFELQKESLCARLKRELQLDELTGESTRQKEDRQFLASMFLLFPGSVEVYDQILKAKGKGER